MNYSKTYSYMYAVDSTGDAVVPSTDPVESNVTLTASSQTPSSSDAVALTDASYLNTSTYVTYAVAGDYLSDGGAEGVLVQRFIGGTPRGFYFLTDQVVASHPSVTGLSRSSPTIELTTSSGPFIVQADTVDEVEDSHVELQTYNVVVSEATISESSVVDDSRGVRHDAQRYLAPDPGASIGPAPYCAPCPHDGSEVATARLEVELRPELGSQSQVARDEQLIFDVGLHRGEDTEFYLKKGYRVVAFEANPSLIELCRSRFAQEIRSEDLNIVGGAIAPPTSTGKVKFYVNQNVSVWGTTDIAWVKRNAARGAESSEIEVDQIDMAEMFRGFGVPFYLKIDIEGADGLVLDALKDFKDRPQFISLEANTVDLSEMKRDLQTLCNLGYKQFQLAMI